MATRMKGMLALALLAAAPAAVAVAVSASAQRFEVTPAPTGVTRVDTATGSVSHCTQSDGVWFCDRVGPDVAVAPPTAVADLKRLSETIAALTAKVDRLAAELAARPAATGAAPAAPAAAPASFAATAVARLVDMVRRLKQPRASNAVTPAAS